MVLTVRRRWLLVVLAVPGAFGVAYGLLTLAAAASLPH